LGKITRQEFNEDLNNELNKIDNKAEYKNGSGTFISGTSHQVNDAFITSNTAITISPTGTPAGLWIINSYNGYFVIISNETESNVTFDWWGVK